MENQTRKFINILWVCIIIGLIGFIGLLTLNTFYLSNFEDTEIKLNFSNEIRKDFSKADKFLHNGEYERAYNIFCNDLNDYRLEYLIKNADYEEELEISLMLQKEYTKICILLEDLKHDNN